MLFTVAMVLLVLWFVGLTFFAVAGSSIHILLLLAMVSLAWHLMTRRRKAA